MMQHPVKNAVLSVLFLGLLWLEGLIFFITLIPTNASSSTQTTDAIVVLTGGSLRLDHGFELLVQNRARRMFISGVEDNVALPSLLHNKDYRPWAEAVAGRVELGHKARTTMGNAEETAEWIAREHIKSIRLVTGTYHMPRSMLELHEASPDVTIIPDPVFPKPFEHNDWWQTEDGRRLVISEYHKYIATLLRHAFHLRAQG